MNATEANNSLIHNQQNDLDVVFLQQNTVFDRRMRETKNKQTIPQ